MPSAEKRVIIDVVPSMGKHVAGVKRGRAYLKRCRAQENVSRSKLKKTRVKEVTPIDAVLFLILLRVSWVIVQSNKRQNGLLKTGDKKRDKSLYFSAVDEEKAMPTLRCVALHWFYHP